MLSLLRRPSRKQAPSSPRPVRLFLEALEGRDCPSTITLNVTYAANRQVILSGQVAASGSGARAGSDTSGVTVQISGAASGTTTTNSGGSYSVTLTANSLGQVQAKTTDGLSNTATAILTVGTPVIQNFGATKGLLNYYTFSGQVTGDVTGGMVITFGGQSTTMDGRTAAVDANGYFSITVQIPSNDLGTVSATAMDWWGLSSNAVYALIS
jgi:hypothetical protein